MLNYKNYSEKLNYLDTKDLVSELNTETLNLVIINFTLGFNFIFA